jgi:superfamily II DNA or RNA helicase
VTAIERLRPHQRDPAQHLLEVLQRFGSAVDASDTGIGKTYISAWIANSLKLPTCVIGPKVAAAPWARAAKHFDDSFSFVNYELIRTGNTPFGKWDSYRPGEEYFRCSICQCNNPAFPCPHHPQGIHCFETKRRAPRYGNFVFHSAIKLLIFDEGHRCNGLDSLNAEMMLAAKRQKIPALALSATPAHSPVNMRALGYLLDLHNDGEDEAIKLPGRILPVRGKPSFQRWLRQYECWNDERWRGLKWFASPERQRKIMLDIRNSIIPARGIRITADSVPGFPKRLILPELYSLDHPEKINGCYHTMAAALEQLKLRAAGDKNPESALTATLRERQQVELLKVPAAAEIAQDDRDKGLSVVFFCCFRQTIDELFKRFPGAGIIDGSPESLKNRDRWVDEFQDNKRREMIVNVRAGSVSLSLHDLLGVQRSGIVFPGWSAEDFRQLLGRLQRDGGLSTAIYRVLFAADTVEEDVYNSLRGKLDCMDALVDGDLMPRNLNMV